MSNPMGLKIYLGPTEAAEEYLDQIRFTTGSSLEPCFNSTNYISESSINAEEPFPDDLDTIIIDMCTVWQSGKTIEITNIEFSENGIDWVSRLNTTYWNSPSYNDGNRPVYSWNGSKWVISSNADQSCEAFFNGSIIIFANGANDPGYWAEGYRPTHARVTFNTVDYVE